MREHKNGLQYFVLFCMYVVCCMLLITIATASYRNVRAKGSEADSIRMTLGYVANKVRAGDCADTISVEEFGDVTALMLRDADYPECETLIYMYKGALREIFKFTEDEFVPGYDTFLAEAAAFEIVDNDDSLMLSVTGTDGKTHTLTMALTSRSGGSL